MGTLLAERLTRTCRLRTAQPVYLLSAPDPLLTGVTANHGSVNSVKLADLIDGVLLHIIHLGRLVGSGRSKVQSRSATMSASGPVTEFKVDAGLSKTRSSLAFPRLRKLDACDVVHTHSFQFAIEAYTENAGKIAFRYPLENRIGPEVLQTRASVTCGVQCHST